MSLDAKDRNAVRAEHDLAMMQNPDRWPQWPFLPLVKRHGGDTGLLYAGEGPVVYLCNLFMVSKKFQTCDKVEYASLEAVIAAGWEVD